MNGDYKFPWFATIVAILFMIVAPCLIWFDYCAYKQRFPQAEWWTWLFQVR